MNFSRSYPVATLCLILACQLWPVQNAYANDSITVNSFLLSEPSYRGLSEAPGEPSLGLNLEWGDWNNIHFGSVIQAGPAVTVPQREKSILFYSGWQKEISDEWNLGFTLSHRIFPQSTKDWDYTEYHAAISKVDWFDVELTYSPNYYEHDTESFTTAIRTFQPLSDDFFITAEAGHLSFTRDIFDDYQYAEVGIGYRTSKYSTELSYTKVSNEGDLLFGTVAQAPGLQLKISYLIY